MKRFFINVIGTELRDAADIAENMLNRDSLMIEHLRQKKGWKYGTDLQGDALVNRLLAKRDPLPVWTYKPFWPYSKVIAYYQYNSIHFNQRKLKDMSKVDLCGTLLHEYAHHCGFSHGGNFISEDKKLHSVPYFLSENVHLWII
jgi:hypothetical protein